MASTAPDRDFRKRIERVESLIAEVERFPDPEARARTQEVLRTVLELHGAGLERILDKLADTGETGLALIDELARDELVAAVLLLHGLHPVDLETRVRQALDKVRPLLKSHGGNVELLGLTDGVAHLRMLGSCDGCPSSAMTLKLAIEKALYEQAPDLVAIEVDGATTNGHAAKDGQTVDLAAHSRAVNQTPGAIRWSHQKTPDRLPSPYFKGSRGSAQPLRAASSAAPRCRAITNT